MNMKLDDSELRLLSTSSPVAYKYHIYALKAFYKEDYNTAINWNLRALAIDSNFMAAISNLTWAYRNSGMTEQSKIYCYKIYRRKDALPLYWRLNAEFLYADMFETPNESINYLKKMQELDDKLNMHFLLGTRYALLFDYDKAITEFEKSNEEIVKSGDLF